MRFGTPWRFAVLASLTLLMSGQLCMLTTCVPRLTHLRNETAHVCCCTAPSTDAPVAPIPAGAMPCEQQLSFADAPTLLAPQPLAAPTALAVEPALSLVPPVWVASAERDLDTGPAPAVHRFAPSGLRAPPRA